MGESDITAIILFHKVIAGKKGYNDLHHTAG
jgi:hypothetical protein